MSDLIDARQSKPLSFTVKRANLVLEKPFIALAPDDLLDPEQVPETGLAVTVAVYGGMAAGDRVKVFFAGLATPEQTVDTLVDLTFSVSKAIVATYAGTNVQVYYDVIRASGESPVASPVIDLEILPLAPPLEFDSSPMLLSGRVYVRESDGAGPTPMPAGASSTRVATGGTPPYTYSSTMQGVASVNQQGVVASRGNGAATISVTDSAGQTASYPVTVSNVFRIRSLRASQYIVFWQLLMYKAQLQEVRLQYQPGGGLAQIGYPTGIYWAHDQNALARPYYVNMDNGVEGTGAQMGAVYPGLQLV